MYDIGIDFGGTKISIGLVEGITVIDTVTIMTKVSQNVEQITQNMVKAIQQLLFRNTISMEHVNAIGVGVPGTANLISGMVEYANNLPFENVDMCSYLKEKLQKPVFFDNDANAAAWGEYILEDSHAESFAMITIGTGIGCGMILQGKIYRGINFAAGEVGHMTIKYNGKQCNCGRKGCFEAYASTNALLDLAREHLQKDIAKQSILWKICKEKTDKLDGIKFFEAVMKKDQIAENILNEYIVYLAHGIANYINIMQPQELRIGGGISKAGQYFMPQLKEQVKEMIYSKNSTLNTRISIAEGYNDAGILGAALLRKNYEE